MTRFAVTHRTTYRYDGAVTFSINQARLQLAADPGQEVRSSFVTVSPRPDDRHSFTDWYGNEVVHFAIESAHDELEIIASSEVDVARVAPPVHAAPATVDVVEELLSSLDPVAVSAREFRLDSPLVRRMHDVEGLDHWVGATLTQSRPMLEAVQELNTRIYTEYTYDPAATTVATPLSDVVANQAGVCQDFAHVAIAACRLKGIPARYVSGYLETRPPPGQTRLRGADASHAWFSVYAGRELGWVDFDPTNDVLVGAQHITAAIGRDYSDVVPLKGVIVSNARSTLDVGVDVEAITEQADRA